MRWYDVQCNASEVIWKVQNGGVYKRADHLTDTIGKPELDKKVRFIIILGLRDSKI